MLQSESRNLMPMCPKCKDSNGLIQTGPRMFEICKCDIKENTTISLEELKSVTKPSGHSNLEPWNDYDGKPREREI